MNDLGKVLVIEFTRYKTIVALMEQTHNSIHASIDNTEELPPVTDFILEGQVEKLAEFFNEIKGLFPLKNTKIHLSLPDSMVRIDLKESEMVAKHLWNAEFSKALKISNPRLEEEPHYFSIPMVTGHPVMDDRLVFTAVSVRKQYINTIINAIKKVNLPIPTIESGTIALTRFIDVWDRPYLMLNIEHDKMSLAVYFNHIGIDLVNEYFGWEEILHTSTGLKKLSDILFDQNARVRARKLATSIKETPIILRSQKANEIGTLIFNEEMQYIPFRFSPCQFIETDMNPILLEKNAIPIGLALRSIYERRNENAIISSFRSDTKRSVPGSRIQQIKATVTSYSNRLLRPFSNRSRL